MNSTEFEEIVSRHGSRVYGYIVYYLGDRSGADDVMQEVLIRLWNKRDTIDTDRVLAWLLTVARNACIDEHRRQQYHRRNVTTDSENIDGFIDSRGRWPDAEAESNMFMEELEKELARLDEPYRSIVILRELQGFKYEEIVDTLGLPISTVKVYLHRARKKLRERLMSRLELSYAE